MNYIWVHGDIVMGRRITSHNSAENYVIGYTHDNEIKSYRIISGRDGQVSQRFDTRQCLAEYLNTGGYRPLSINPNERPPLEN